MAGTGTEQAWRIGVPGWGEEASELRCGDAEESSQALHLFFRASVWPAGLCGARVFGG